MAVSTVLPLFVATFLCLIWCLSCQVLRFDVSRKLASNTTTDPCAQLRCSSVRQEKQVVRKYISLSVLERAEGKPITKLVSVFPRKVPVVHKSHTPSKRVVVQGKVTSNRAELYVTIDAAETCENKVVYKCQLNFLDMQGQHQTAVAEKGQSTVHSWTSESAPSSGVLLTALQNVTDRLDAIELRLDAVESRTRPDKEVVAPLNLPQFKVLPRVLVISRLGFPVLQNNLYGGGWIVFQRRKIGNVDFFRSWNDYRNGFGGLDGDFWLGNQRIHQLTSIGYNELRVDMTFGDKKAFAFYTHFSVSGETDKYRLNVSDYLGTAGDSLKYHSGQQFSAFDSDNDEKFSTSCALTYQSGWWFVGCQKSNLNGEWNSTEDYRGPRWEGFTGTKSASSTEMMIRRTLN